MCFFPVCVESTWCAHHVERDGGSSIIAETTELVESVLTVHGAKYTSCGAGRRKVRQRRGKPRRPATVRVL